MEKWSEQKAWEWYNSRPWIRGCNYMSASCANRVDQWQSLHFEEYLLETEQELQVMQSLGYNAVRLILEYVVWEKEHDTFLKNFERYISLCHKYGISCMIVLANDCMPPKTELWKMPDIGEQHYDVGYHGGRKHSQHGAHSGPAPHFYLDNKESAERYFQMIEEIVTIYKDDPRILMWDVFNEPGNSRREGISLPILKKVFEVVRGVNPTQPLTAAAWWFDINDFHTSEENRFALENSDIISYHCYERYENHVRIIKHLKTYNRPLVNSEWLARITNNTVFDNFPLFYLENIGCFNWGFVAGKYQTYEPWENTWVNYYNGNNTDVDFTKWFHDLYRPNHRPYDPKEIELIKRFAALADRQFEGK